jgi:predicted ATPase/DNA-binding SARP family transcriptional activator/tetratricopeptide (TPR) repeat protein
VPGLDVFLFGKPHVERDGAPVIVGRRKALALLAYLAVTRQPQGRDTVVALLWPDLDSERGRAALRSTLAGLHRAVGEEGLAVEGDQLALQEAPYARVDVARFHTLLAQVAAHDHPPHRLCDSCLAALTGAADLYRGDFLAGFTLKDAAEFDAWQTFQTESLRLELAGSLEKLASSLAGRHEHAAAIGHARRWLALDPLNENAHRHLMQLHAWAGDRAAAVRQYHECTKILHEEVGVEPEPETSAVFEAIRGGAAGQPSPALPLCPTPTHNLPADPTPFIGREREQTQMAARLADPACHLLTVLGPGGIGKTRLAVQAARSEAEHFAHGACFVDLTPVSSADLLAATILRTLQVSAQGAAEPDQHILHYLADKQMLLILDNYEHLLTGPEPDRRDGYGLVTKMLGAAPGIKLLVTSRSRLNVHAEWLVPLEGLEIPTEKDLDHEAAMEHEEREARGGVRDPSHPAQFAHFAPLRDFAVQPTTLDNYSATALFNACARRVQPDFRPTAEDAHHIVHICRLLDGMPLAIELAAAWARTLPLAKIAHELERGLGVLTTTMRDLPPRHRSMVAAFDHSWRLLSDREQSILCQLSVFRGGWTAEAAESVAGATLADLGSLADASWLLPAGGGRYGMHELIRQYCAGKLETEHERATGERASQVHNRHAGYFRSLLLAHQGEFFRRPSVIPEMAAEYANLLASWHWAVAAEDLDTVRTMILGLHWIADLEGGKRAFKSLLEAYAGKLRAAAETQSLDPDRSREMNLTLATVLAAVLDDLLGLSRESWQVWVDAAMSLLARGDADDERWMEIGWLLRSRVAFGHIGWRNCTESASLFAALIPELDGGRFRLWPYTEEARYYWQAEGTMWWGYAALHLGRYEESERLARQCLATGEQSGIPLLRLSGLVLLASVLISTGDCRQAELELREYLRISRAHGLKYLVAVAFWHLGMAFAGQGSYVRARACVQRTLAWAKENGQLMDGALQLLACVELALGNLAQAKRCYRQVISVAERSGFSILVASALTGLARATLAAGDLVEARGHLLRALRLLRESRALEYIIGALAAMVELLQAEGQIEAATELCSALLSWPATPYCVLETAQRVRPELETRLQKLAEQLPPEVFAAATARGRNRQIDEMVAELASAS